MEQALPTGSESIAAQTAHLKKSASQKLMVRQMIQDAVSEMNLVLDDRLKGLLKARKSELNPEDKDVVKALKDSIRAKIRQGLESGAIPLDPNSKTTPKKYASGLLSNWLRKDKFFTVG